jgi:hypothetical protein
MPRQPDGRPRGVARVPPVIPADDHTVKQWDTDFRCGSFAAVDAPTEAGPLRGPQQSNRVTTSGLSRWNTEGVLPVVLTRV